MKMKDVKITKTKTIEIKSASGSELQVRIEVFYFKGLKDGGWGGTEEIDSTTMKLLKDGKVIAKTSGMFLATEFKGQPATRLGDVYIAGHDAYNEIDAARKELRDELERELEELPTETIKNKKQEEERIVAAKSVIKLAEAQGIDNLKSQKEVNKKLNALNNVLNERGEGYLPRIVSREEYQRALEILEKL